jgi:hypothetical protein
VSSAPVARTGVGASQISRRLAAEMRRLVGDPVLWIFVPVTALAALSAMAALPPDIHSAPPGVIRSLAEVLGEGAVGTLLILAAVQGALAVALAEKNGVLAREHLFARGSVVIAARAASAAISGTILGMCGTAILTGAFLLVTGSWLFPVRTAVVVSAATVVATLWGFLLGALVRHPIIVLFVVPATLMPALLLSNVAPDVSGLLPMPAMLSMAGVASRGIEFAPAVALCLGWLVLLGVVMSCVRGRRDAL